MQNYQSTYNPINYKELENVKEKYNNSKLSYPFEEFVEKLEYGENYTDIGKHFNISRERVRQLYNKYFTPLFPTKRKIKSKQVIDLSNENNFRPFITEFHKYNLDFNWCNTKNKHYSKELLFVNGQLCKLYSNPILSSNRKYHRINCSITTLEKIKFILVYRVVEGKSEFFILPTEDINAVSEVTAKHCGLYIPVKFTNRKSGARLDYNSYKGAWHLLGGIN